jgi:hypothetical protein
MIREVHLKNQCVIFEEICELEKAADGLLSGPRAAMDGRSRALHGSSCLACPGKQTIRRFPALVQTNAFLKIAFWKKQSTLLRKRNFYLGFPCARRTAPYRWRIRRCRQRQPYRCAGDDAFGDRYFNIDLQPEKCMAARLDGFYRAAK